MTRSATSTRQPRIDPRRNHAKRKPRSSREADAAIVIPTLTKALADEFALLLSTGIPAIEALRFIAPTPFEAMVLIDDRDGLTKWMRSWMAHPLLFEATATLNAGEWTSLTADRRIEVALDKHFAQLAYFLYTCDYDTLDGNALKKADLARQALVDKLKVADDANEESALIRALRGIIEGAVSGGNTPPQLEVEEGESLSVEAVVALDPIVDKTTKKRMH